MAWKHPLSDIDLGAAEIAAVTEVLLSKWLSQGPRTAQFEQCVAEYTGARHAVAVSSCTAALHLALAALDVGAGDEVLLPSYTFVATANAALYQRARPVLVDVVGENDLNLDPGDLQRKITPRTRAIIVVHLAGFVCDMERLMQIAGAHDLPVIEDASHALGTTYEGGPGGRYSGRHAGTIGTIGCYSFFANKNLPTGEGGMLVTDDERIAERVRLLRSHGMTRTSWDKSQGSAADYDVVELGYNYRTTEMAAALGIVQLEQLDSHNTARRRLVARYREHFDDCRHLTVPFGDRLEDGAHHIFPVLLEETAWRTAFRKRLADRGIQTSVHYPPVHQFSHFRQRFGEPVDLPQTEAAAAREVTLPLHPLMTLAAVDEIAAAVKEIAAAQVNDPIV